MKRAIVNAFPRVHCTKNEEVLNGKVQFLCSGSCVCFELSFKASESLKLPIPSCGSLYLVKVS